MKEEMDLLHLFEHKFSPEQKAATQRQFERLAQAFPHKSAVEMWLTAIADVRDWSETMQWKSPWLEN